MNNISPIQQFVDETHTIAEQILNPQPPIQDGLHPDQTIGKVKIYRLCSLNWVGKPIPFRQPSGQEGMLNHIVHVIHFMLFTVVGSISSYLVWQNFKHLKDASQEIQLTRKFRREHLHTHQTGEKLERLKEITNAREQIFTKIRRDAASRIALTVAVIGAATLGITAAILLSKPLIIAAAATAGVVTSWLLIRAFTVGCRKTIQRKCAEKINEARRSWLDLQGAGIAGYTPSGSGWNFTFIDKGRNS